MTAAGPIKVLHVASGDLWAGAEVQLFTLAKALQRTPGVSVTVVLLNYGKLEQELSGAGVKVTVLDESRLNSFQIFRQLTNEIRKIKPDVIHTHRSKENILGSIAAFRCGNIPSLRTTHGAPEHKPPWFKIPKRLISFMDWFCGRYLQNKIIAVSEDLAEILKKRFPPSKVGVIENGIDLGSFAKLASHKNVHMTPPGNHVKVGIAGRLVPVKRVDLFIEAAANFLNTHPEFNVSFHIFGDGPLRHDLEKLAQKLKTENAIHFEGHRDDMRQKLSDLDVLLMTSDHEGLPMVLLEAMALQTPIVAHNVGGIPELLDHGNCGVLVSDHRPHAYADSLYELVINPEQRKLLTDNAFARANYSYSSEKNADAYLSIYQDTLRRAT